MTPSWFRICPMRKALVAMSVERRLAEVLLLRGRPLQLVLLGRLMARRPQSLLLGLLLGLLGVLLLGLRRLLALGLMVRPAVDLEEAVARKRLELSLGRLRAKTLLQVHGLTGFESYVTDGDRRLVVLVVAEI